jgi:hypothetical protein
MGEDQGGPGDVADSAWAGGDVLQGPPAAGEQGKPAFAQAAQLAEERVAGAGIDIEFLAAGWLPDRDADADAGALVSQISRGGQPVRGRDVERRQGVDAGGGEVVHRSRLNPGDPQREPVRRHDRLDVAAVRMRLAGVPHVDELTLDAEGLLAAPVLRDDRRPGSRAETLVTGPFQRLAQVRASSASTSITSSRYR